MLVHKKRDSELVFDLSAFEKNDQSEIERIKQILQVSEIIKTAVRQSRITDVGQYETENNKQRIPAIPKEIAAEIIGIINERVSDAQDFDTHTQNVITLKEDEPLKILKVRFAKGEISKYEYDEMKSLLDQKIMPSEKHQRLVNALALKLEVQHEIKITGIVIDDLQCFDQKFRNLPMPNDHDGIPDIQGIDSNGKIHLGIAKIDVNDSNVEKQLRSFSSRYMKGTKIPARLHVIVPKEIRADMESKIHQIGLRDELVFGIITISS